MNYVGHSVVEIRNWHFVRESVCGEITLYVLSEGDMCSMRPTLCLTEHIPLSHRVHNPTQRALTLQNI